MGRSLVRLAEVVRSTRDPELIAELAPVTTDLDDLAERERPESESGYAGIFLTSTARAFAVSYSYIEVDGRGHPHRVRTWKHFPRGEPHDIGSGEFVDALEAARRFKSQREVEVALGRQPQHEVTLNDAFREHMEAEQHRPNTVDGYQRTWRNHIAPKLGRWALSALTVDVVEDWWGSLDCGPEAKKKAGRLLRAVVRRQWRRGRIPTDPTRVLRVGASGVRKVAPEDFPTIEDVTRLADAAEPRDRLAILLMGRMGLRIGEVFALRVRDVDLKTRRLHVARTVSSESPLTYGPPKTDRGDRRLKLPEWMVDELRAHLERFRPDAGPNDLIAVTSRAEPCRPTNWRSRNYRAAADRARVRVTAHVLRRAAASSWIARGASPTAVAARLGDDVRVVLSTYAHAFPSEDEAIAALDEVDG